MYYDICNYGELGGVFLGDKKSFFKGVLLGVVATATIGTTIDSGISLFKRYVLNDISISQKTEYIKDIIDTYYVNSYDEQTLEDYMYKGMLESLGDNYSSYMTASEFDRVMDETNGEYVGIGVLITVSHIDAQITINKVFDNSPAYESGLQAGDLIIKVDDIDVNFENYSTITDKIKGVEGTSVKIGVERPSTNEEILFDMTRRSVEVPTINHELLDDNIGYIEITQFDRVTLEQFKSAYEILGTTDGLIIDLRNNPGGLLTTVNDITDMLIPEGHITYLEYKDGERVYFDSDANSYNKPLVILVNGSSASASEVLAGAVQDHGVGVLVGETTYGKGVVQNMYSVSDGSAVKVTIAKYYTPNGICIDGLGIEPDYPVSNILGSSEDLQLEKGIEVIKKSLS